MTGEARQVVTEQETAAKLGTGLASAYSTPSMIALMENASVATIAAEMSLGQTTVGIYISVKHVTPTPVGMHVTARSVLQEIDVSHLVQSGSKGQSGKNRRGNSYARDHKLRAIHASTETEDNTA
jgi:predicted thioesterase